MTDQLAVALLVFGCAGETTVSTPSGVQVVLEGSELRGYNCHYSDLYLRSVGLAAELVPQALATCGYDYWSLDMGAPLVCFTDTLGDPAPDATGYLAGITYGNGDILITTVYPWGTQVDIVDMAISHEFVHLFAYHMDSHRDGDPLHSDPTLWECALPIAVANFVSVWSADQ